MGRGLFHLFCAEEFLESLQGACNKRVPVVLRPAASCCPAASENSALSVNNVRCSDGSPSWHHPERMQERVKDIEYEQHASVNLRPGCRVWFPSLVDIALAAEIPL